MMPVGIGRAASMRSVLILAILLAVGVGCAPLHQGLQPPHGPDRSVAGPPPCYECFWKNHSAQFRGELVAVYGRMETDDPLIDAERHTIVARVSGSASDFAQAARLYGKVAQEDANAHRRLLALETLAFTAAERGDDPASAFRAAAAAARSADEPWKAGLYEDVAAGRFAPLFAVDAGSDLVVARPRHPEARAFVLGASTITVRPDERLGVQVERTVRDWISYQLAYDMTGNPPSDDALIGWHEGRRIRDITAAARVTVLPLEGILAVRRGERWFAADETGQFRYEVLPDKIQYPSTRAYGDLALMVDTHGISSLVEPAVRLRADMVVGCGDHPEKMKAALHLAALGLDVYFPCDRFVGEVLGYDAPGTLLGSAPVRAGAAGAIVGDRPIEFSVAETIVAEDTHLNSDDRYYDAPARYFRRLSEMVPLHLDVVAVSGAGESDKVVARAEALGASVIGIRVMTKEDAAPVRRWLSGSAGRRAVLFHSAPYPDGNALFGEFPDQTTFGDPRPRFLPR